MTRLSHLKPVQGPLTPFSFETPEEEEEAQDFWPQAPPWSAQLGRGTDAPAKRRRKLKSPKNRADMLARVRGLYQLRRRGGVSPAPSVR
jgi:hypothetical protein